MRQSVVIQLELPRDWKHFRLPAALHGRLQELLDRQDQEGRLSAGERREAKALVELSEMLTLMRLRAARASSGKAS